MTALFSKKQSDKAVEEIADKELQVDAEEKVGIEPATPAMAVPKSDDASAYHGIVGPHITEKAGNMGAQNKYVFKVTKDSNKIGIRRSIEKLYKVNVLEVNIQNMPSKFRQVGRHQGTKSGFKKAIVTIKEGQKIEVV